MVLKWEGVGDGGGLDDGTQVKIYVACARITRSRYGRRAIG